MKKNLTFQINNKGFTLIETIIAMAIFVIVIQTISNLFITGVRNQGVVLTTQRILDQASYAMEYMGRDLRMAKKEENAPNCLSDNGKNYELTTDGIKFINYNGECTEFFLDGSQLKQSEGTTTLPLTSAKITVNSLNFDISGSSEPPSDYLQPRITILLELLGEEISGGHQPKIQIQTSVTQRNLDVQTQ